MQKFHYVYITTNNINGMQYVGSHSTSNLNDNYLGSGKALKDALKEYNKKCFAKKIIEHFSSRSDALQFEESCIKLYNTLSPNGYNIYSTCKNANEYIVSVESVEKIRNAQTGRKYSEEAKKRMSESHIGEKHTKERIEKAASKNRGTHHKSPTLAEGRKPGSGRPRKNKI
jgi:hypothetical protein